MAKASNHLIAIDDGHGPHTAGKRTPYIASLGRSIRENEFNEAVADKLEASLKRCGFRTLQTAAGDSDTPLTTRTSRANAAKADLLVSLHFNAMGNTFGYSSARGFSVHIQPADKAWSGSGSLKFANLAVEELAKGTKQINRGVVGQNLHMTRESNMPAALVECGFMDDPVEALLMINPAFQDETAEDLCRAVCRYFGVHYVSGESKALSTSSNKSETRLGEVRLKKDMNYRSAPSLDSKVLRVLKAGHGSAGNVHYYEEKGHWLRLGAGWVSNPDGKYVEITKVYEKEKPKAEVYRVVIDGKQVGAYSKDDNILQEAQEAVAKGAKNIKIEKV